MAAKKETVAKTKKATTKKETTQKEEKAEQATTYSKKTLLNAKIFANRKDALNVLVGDDELLSIDEVQERLNNFMKEEVK